MRFKVQIEIPGTLGIETITFGDSFDDIESAKAAVAELRQDEDYGDDGVTIRVLEEAKDGRWVYA